jgi:hypothetical protein
MAIAFSGAQAAGEVDKFAERSIAGKKNNLAAGRPAAGRSGFYFTDLRDGTGKRVGIVFNEAYRLLFDLVADLLLQGISYDDIAKRVNEQGYRTPAGKPFTRAYFYHILWRSTTWGHLR